jgi:hypothetical protein
VNRPFETQQEEQYLLAHMCMCAHTREHTHTYVESRERENGTYQNQMEHS